MAGSRLVKPKLIVFDLDYTLWPFWVDTHVNPPFRKVKGKVLDSSNDLVEHYKDSPDILNTLKKEGYILAIASRTGAPIDAQSLLDLFGWNEFFTHKEMYPGGKVTHLKRIQQDSGVPFSEMIFFDDESRNILDTGKIGVFGKLVRNGINWNEVRDALAEFSKRQSPKC